MTSSGAGVSSRLVTCFAVVAGAVIGSVAGANPGREPSQKVLAIGVSLATTKPGASEVARRAAVTQWIETRVSGERGHLARSRSTERWPRCEEPLSTTQKTRLAERYGSSSITWATRRSKGLIPLRASQRPKTFALRTSQAGR